MYMCGGQPATTMMEHWRYIYIYIYVYKPTTVVGKKNSLFEDDIREREYYTVVYIPFIKMVLNLLIFCVMCWYVNVWVACICWTILFSEKERHSHACAHLLNAKCFLYRIQNWMLCGGKKSSKHYVRCGMQRSITAHKCTYRRGIIYCNHNGLRPIILCSFGWEGCDMIFPCL